MLKIDGLFQRKRGQLIVGSEIPFRFRAYDGILPAPYLWAVGTKTSLLEITIDRDSRALLGVTLVLYNRKLIRGVSLKDRHIESIPGVPTINVDAYADYGYDQSPPAEEYDFDLIQDENTFLIPLERNITPSRCFQIDRVRFLECKQQLCAIQFVALNETELTTLDQYWSKFDSANRT